MPKRGAARDRAQATVDAAVAGVQPTPPGTDEDQSLLIRVSPERWEALTAGARGRSLEAIVAEIIDEHLRKIRAPASSPPWTGPSSG